MYIASIVDTCSSQLLGRLGKIGAELAGKDGGVVDMTLS